MIEKSGLFMGIKEGRGNPELLKLGLRLALSLGGIVFTFLRYRVKTLDGKSLGESDEGKFKKNHLQSQDEAFLLPEFDVLVKEYPVEDEAPCRVNWLPVSEPPEIVEFFEEKEDGNRIRSLEDKVKFLEDRERILENQLLEFYGFKEQDAVIKELQDRIQIHSSEAKAYELKIESLQECNRRLEAKVADYTTLVVELEEAKAMLKVLRKKLQCEAEQNREQILNLQQRVIRMQEEQTGDQKNDANVELRFEETRDLEVMKKANEDLKMENSDLDLNLEKSNRQVEELKGENRSLEEQNEVLNKEIEQLQTDRCADVEELVYLRWINACLRYELRHYQPGLGETAARDLGRTLSPKSEEQAKKLILEYAMKEGSEETMSSFGTFNCGHWHADMLPSAVTKPNSSRHTTLFAKLFKIWRDKDNRNHDQKPAEEVITLKTPRTSSLPSLRSSFDLNGSEAGCQMSNTMAEVPLMPGDQVKIDIYQYSEKSTL